MSELKVAYNDSASLAVVGSKNGGFALCTGPDREINANLIATAVTGCRLINPTNPLTAAEALVEMWEALKRIATTRPLTGPLNLTDLDMQEIARQAIAKATRE